jgi:hypothetical protein
VTQLDTPVWRQHFGESTGGDGGIGLTGEGGGGAAAVMASESYVSADAPLAAATVDAKVAEPVASETAAPSVEQGSIALAPAMLGAPTTAVRTTSVVAMPGSATLDAPANDAAFIAWLDSLDDGEVEAADDGFAMSNPADDSDGEAELEGIDALFDLIGT